MREGLLVEELDTSCQPDLYAVRQKVILAEEVLLLDPVEHCRVILLSDRHKKGPAERALSLGSDAKAIRSGTNAVFRNPLGIHCIAECEANPLLTELVIRNWLALPLFHELNQLRVWRHRSKKLFSDCHDPFSREHSNS